MCEEKTKKCYRCGMELPATTEYFRKLSNSKDGLNHICKECLSAKHKQKDVLVLEGLKYCECCDRVLPASILYFDKHGKAKDGLEKTCRECKGLRFYDSKTWICPTCGKELPFTEEYWKPSKAESCGWITSMCRECWNAYYRVYTKENPEWRREKERKYKEAHPDKVQAKLKRHYEKAKAEGKTTYKYVMSHASDSTKERIKQRGKTLKRILHEKLRWERRKGEEYNARARELNALHPEIRRANTERRRALVIGAKGDHTGQQFKWRYEFHGCRCYYCKKPLTIHEATEDHRIPLSRGGTNWASNLVPACRSCNSSKGAKTETEYWKYLKGLEGIQADSSLSY